MINSVEASYAVTHFQKRVVKSGLCTQDSMGNLAFNAGGLDCAFSVAFVERSSRLKVAFAARIESRTYVMGHEFLNYLKLAEAQPTLTGLNANLWNGNALQNTLDHLEQLIKELKHTNLEPGLLANIFIAMECTQ